jgi:hypothetical protein
VSARRPARLIDETSTDVSDPVHFVAPDHGRWTVHQVHDPSTASGASLIFASAAGFRRVRTFPEGWRSLSAAALWELSWQR